MSKSDERETHVVQISARKEEEGHYTLFLDNLVRNKKVALGIFNLEIGESESEISSIFESSSLFIAEELFDQIIDLEEERQRSGVENLFELCSNADNEVDDDLIGEDERDNVVDLTKSKEIYVPSAPPKIVEAWKEECEECGKFKANRAPAMKDGSVKYLCQTCYDLKESGSFDLRKDKKRPREEEA